MATSSQEFSRFSCAGFQLSARLVADPLCSAARTAAGDVPGRRPSSAPCLQITCKCLEVLRSSPAPWLSENEMLSEKCGLAPLLLKPPKCLGSVAVPWLVPGSLPASIPWFVLSVLSLPFCKARHNCYNTLESGLWKQHLSKCGIKAELISFALNVILTFHLFIYYSKWAQSRD